MEILFDEEDLEPLFPELSDSQMNSDPIPSFGADCESAAEVIASGGNLQRSMQKDERFSPLWISSGSQSNDTATAARSEGKKSRGKPTLLMRAIGCLSRREYSERELRSKLSKFSQNEAEIEAVVERLKTNGYLSNSRFAENYVRANSRKKGSAAIRYELSRHNLSPELMEKVLGPLKETETARAYAIWSRKFELSNDRKERERQYRFLAYRGFSSDAIRKVVCGEYFPEAEE